VKKKPKHLAYLEGWLSIIINTILFGFKYWAGILTGSVAIIADAWHTLSDSITSIVVILGAKASSKPADKEHPFGHGRAELIASIIISVLLGVVGFNFFVESINRIIHQEKAIFGITAIIVFIISAIVKEGIARYAFWAGKTLKSNSLRADGWHHRSDAIASFVILIGIFLSEYFWWIDGILGIIVAVLILYTAFDILRQGISPLLGESPDEKLIQAIHNIAQKVNPKDIHIHHIHIHRYGGHTELSFHIKLEGKTELNHAHQLATQIENAINKELGMEVTIHVEPEDEK
jgi:cation diffusion facilitator family transporter